MCSAGTSTCVLFIFAFTYLHDPAKKMTTGVALQKYVFKCTLFNRWCRYRQQIVLILQHAFLPRETWKFLPSITLRNLPINAARITSGHRSGRPWYIARCFNLVHVVICGGIFEPRELKPSFTFSQQLRYLLLHRHLSVVNQIFAPGETNLWIFI